MQIKSKLHNELEDDKCYGKEEKVEKIVRRTRGAGLGEWAVKQEEEQFARLSQVVNSGLLGKGKI